MIVKVVSTPELLRLARVAQMRDYNRQIDPDWIEEFLDPQGAHVLEFLIPHEHAQGKEVPLHARCQVLLKVEGTMNPMQAFLDIPIKEYNALPAAEYDKVVA
jgi:hypothetical protein